MVKIERLSIDGVKLGEGPYWDIETQSLLFVDVRVSKVHMYTPATNRFISTTISKEHATFIIPVKGQKDHFIVGEKLNILLIHWDTANNKIVSKKILATMPDPPTNRLNDAKCDSTGRLWLGTMTNANGKDIVDGAGFFYSYSKKEGLKLQLEKVTISNGIAMPSNNKKFWFIDSGKYTVDEFDFNIDSGEIRNMKVLFDLKKNHVSGLPDGMTIDTDENLWIALFGGAKVIQVSPSTGELLRTIDFPTAHQITSVCFGGPNLDELYVTSADDAVTQQDAAKYSQRGSIFRVTGLGVRGHPATPFDLSQTDP